ncbi:uncharacterized protein EV422DRAFT_563521 [Fimicolochytrium jonesii]|uniref:uncharacterized protein n=1 Tax=Fimicolochytrium jonesii TaxID=1396493 RepID=UPI0022FF11F0|nr:uncharacterized protein EV422DRAFT_563521 [Fimicolochytrium jonesii]KAI8825689.1 hypothetical protein EV422DRAFT_563521 [Fimicolochytrium jonesii]
MRFLRTTFHLSARAARRARASGSIRTPPPSSAFAGLSSSASASASHRFLASVNRQASAGLHTGSPLLNALETAKGTEEALTENVGQAGSASPFLLAAEDGEESEMSNSVEERLHIDSGQPKPTSYAEIEAIVKKTVEAIVQSTDPEAWRSVQLASPSLKFKIVSRSLAACHLRISNRELTNIMSVQDLLTTIERRERGGVPDPFTSVDAIEQMFARKADSLPPNLYFMQAHKELPGKAAGRKKRAA